MANPWQWPPNPADDHILRTSNTEAACLARAGALASGLANHCGCPVGQDASHWPTPSVGPLDRKRTALANHFGCALDRKRTASGQPLRLSLISLSQPPSVVPLVKMHRVGQPPFGCALDRKCTALANPLRLCPRSKVHRVRPTQRPYSHLANHLGCACQPFRLCCQLLQLCLPAITAVPPSFGDRCDRPGRSAGPVFGFTCQPSRLCLPTISVVLPAIAAVLASYYSCAPIFWGPLRSAWPIGLARLRIHLPTISVVLRSLRGARQRVPLYTSDSLCDDGGPGASTQTASTAPTAPTAARDSRLLRQYARRDVQLGFRRQLQRLRPRLGVPPGPGPTARVPLCIVTSGVLVR